MRLFAWIDLVLVDVARARRLPIRLGKLVILLAAGALAAPCAVWPRLTEGVLVNRGVCVVVSPVCPDSTFRCRSLFGGSVLGPGQSDLVATFAPALMIDCVELAVCHAPSDLQVAWHKGGQALICLPTGEVAPLPARDALWQVAGEGEHTFLHNEGVSLWVADMLQQQLYMDNAGGKVCILDGDKQVFIDDFIARRLPLVEMLFNVAGVGQVRLRVDGWQRPRYGSRLRWDALLLHRSLQLKCQKGQAGRWAEHGWARGHRVATDDFLLQEGVVLRKPVGEVAEGGDTGANWAGDQGVCDRPTKSPLLRNVIGRIYIYPLPINLGWLPEFVCKYWPSGARHLWPATPHTFDECSGQLLPNSIR